MKKLSENINLAIGFLSGITFSNAIGALLQGQLVMSVLLIIAVLITVLLKKFVDWELE